MTIRIPGWLWWLLTGIVAGASILVAFLTLQRRTARPDPTDPYQEIDPVYRRTVQLEQERAAEADAEIQVHAEDLAEVLAMPDPDARTTEIARLLEAWNP